MNETQNKSIEQTQTTELKPKAKIIPKRFKSITQEKAESLLDEILFGENEKTRRMALAVIIASVADGKGKPEKYQIANVLLQRLFLDTEQCKTHFAHYLNKAKFAYEENAGDKRRQEKI